MNPRAKAWELGSASWILSLILGGSLLVFGMIGLFSPGIGALLYGLGAAGVALKTFYHAKAMRDLVLSVFLLTSVFMRRPRAAFLVNLGGVPIAIMDLSVVWRLNTDARGWALILHGGTVVALLITLALLRGRLNVPQPTARRPAVLADA